MSSKPLTPSPVSCAMIGTAICAAAAAAIVRAIPAARRRAIAEPAIATASTAK
jgi:hypothetical protein